MEEMETVPNIEVLGTIQHCRQAPTKTSISRFYSRDRDSESMILFLIMFGLALGAESTSPDSAVKLQRLSCPVFWYSFNERCYKYVATHMAWADAELYCVSQRANLVSIHSQNEQSFVEALIKNSDPAQRATWIGLSDIHKEGKWMWSDGSAVKFTFWNTGEPNNDKGNEHCVQTNWDINLKWNDLPCSLIYAFVCASRTVSP